MPEADTDLDTVIARSHEALDHFMRGDPKPLQSLFSRRDDVTLGNPFGPFARGWADVEATMGRAATNYRDGEAVGFDRLSENRGETLAYIVETERFRAKVGASDTMSSLALRCTTVLRREDGGWRIVHRHADPITGARPAKSIIPPAG
jgi:ketosteroid isomerase-like protein